MGRLIAVEFLIVFAAIFSFGQYREQKAPEQLQTFESQLLVAGLNGDDAWLEKFYTEKLSVLPNDTEPFKERVVKTLGLIDPTLRPDEYKIRITGTVHFLTSDPNKNRSFDFLDTFNKRGGKWQVIASNLSAEKSDDGETNDEIQKDLTDLENQLAQADVMHDSHVFERIVAADFVGTSASGDVRNRQEWLAAQEREHIKQATKSDVQVRVYSENLAIVIGTETVVTTEANGRETTHRDRFTDIWMRRNSQWQCVAEHVSRL